MPPPRSRRDTPPPSELLNGWARRPGHKVLLFSQHTRMLDVLEAFLADRSVSFARFDGSMVQARRAEAIRRFKGAPAVTVLLISTRAGGVGLNLTVANNVVIMEPILRGRAGACCVRVRVRFRFRLGLVKVTKAHAWRRDMMT